MLQDHELNIANMIYRFIHCDRRNGMFDDNMNDPPMGFQKNFFDTLALQLVASRLGAPWQQRMRTWISTTASRGRTLPSARRRPCGWSAHFEFCYRSNLRFLRFVVNGRPERYHLLVFANFRRRRQSFEESIISFVLQCFLSENINVEHMQLFY